MRDLRKKLIVHTYPGAKKKKKIDPRVLFSTVFTHISIKLLSPISFSHKQQSLPFSLGMKLPSVR